MNTKRGVLTLKTGEAEYAFTLSTNAMVRYQDLAGENFVSSLVALESNGLDLKRLRRMFWCGLSHIEGMTEDTAGDIIDELGQIEAVTFLVQAVKVAFPQAEVGNAQNRKARRAAAAAT